MLSTYTTRKMRHLVDKWIVKTMDSENRMVNFPPKHAKFYQGLVKHMNGIRIDQQFKSRATIQEGIFNI